MQLLPDRTLPLALLLFVTTASGCGGPGGTSLAIPPAPDIQQSVEPKPVPTDAILTSDQASEDYNASVEAWGDRVSAAAGRMCRFYEDMKVPLPFKCPPPKGPPGEAR